MSLLLHYKRTVCLLWISNAIFCALLFFLYLVKFDAVNVDTHGTAREAIFAEKEHVEHKDDRLEDMMDWSLDPYSMCYIFNPSKDKHNASRIALVTVSDLGTYPHPKAWHALSRMNRLLYAQRFSYDYCEFPRDWDFTTLRETRWVKFGALYTVLRFYSYVVWLDADTLFWNSPYISLQRNAMQWFHNYTNLSVLFSDHGKHSQNINSGIFILRHSPFAFNFLEQCYSAYVNQEMTKHHADQDAFQDVMEHNNSNNEIMMIPSKYMQRIYVQANPQHVEDDYKKLYAKQGQTIIFHRVGGGPKKYFQMLDVIKHWMEPNILRRMNEKCPTCFIEDQQNETWRDAVRLVNMKPFENQKGNQILRIN